MNTECYVGYQGNTQLPPVCSDMNWRIHRGQRDEFLNLKGITSILGVHKVDNPEFVEEDTIYYLKLGRFLDKFCDPVIRLSQYSRKTPGFI